MPDCEHNKTGTKREWCTLITDEAFPLTICGRHSRSDNKVQLIYAPACWTPVCDPCNLLLEQHLRGGQSGFAVGLQSTNNAPLKWLKDDTPLVETDIIDAATVSALENSGQCAYLASPINDGQAAYSLSFSMCNHKMSYVCEVTTGLSKWLLSDRSMFSKLLSFVY